ncbi:precorrin-6A/cobalt-precorrin-6A reductase [Robbsia andropogonis]|uniref:precorrin-6A/cobalt-precorrin-6A reductase n=1 Tax=Robbsia andropogonis TaxID=28092 RepID=UPI00209F5760|nr:precorrin-6A/cobalt-precorrin-6A reductase [Robbsia andropogonis]MCP1119578.1 precorrin-6A/cobalt-precorrin-6A reductase [Robbsia andropogonis]MCP1129561.1 precorrin-6A/cobalt-precorrin-6A reductase [Robbsia andropogonis]
MPTVDAMPPPRASAFSHLPRILLLGGTGDALAIARHLREADVYSVAGLGASPPDLPCLVREGGFGGAEGLARTLGDGEFGLVVDATHPYAARISTNAVAASGTCRIPYWRLERPPWAPTEGDRWIDVADWAQTLTALRPFRRPLWTVGREPLAHIRSAAPGQHWYVRCLPQTAARHANAVPPFPPGAAMSLLAARGPFTLASERTLIHTLGVDVIVSKNSGGDATDAKLQVAREFGLPVIMRRRPAPAWAARACESSEAHEGILDIAYSSAQHREVYHTVSLASCPIRLFHDAEAVLQALSTLT